MPLATLHETYGRSSALLPLFLPEEDPYIAFLTIALRKPRLMKTNFASVKRCGLPLLSLALTLFAALLLPASAQAQLLFDLLSEDQKGNPGSTLTFSGSLTNQGSSELFLTGDTFTLNAPGMTLDDSPFLNGFPLSLQAGETASGDLFTVFLGANPQPGTSFGTFTLLGGPNDGDMNVLATRPFSVTPVPEPGTVALLVAGGAMLGGVSLRRRKAGMRPTSKPATR